jgi:hypothetical protein
MNNRRMTPLAVPGVLDFAPGAAAAYSLRNLSYTYAGPVVTVRRSTDSAEADFTASEVSDGTLAAWCGGGDGFVDTWYDQSGYDRDATASGAAQPKIVDSGVLVTEGGKPALSFDGVNDTLSSSFSAGDSSSQSIVAVFKPAAVLSGFGGIADCRDANDDGPGIAQVTDNIRFHVNADDRLIEDTASFYIAVACYGNSVSSLSLNGVVAAGNAAASFSVAATYALGNSSFGSTGHFNGTISEIIIYPTDQTALRTSIEGNMNRRFGVF